MSMIDTPNMERLTQILDLTTARHQQITNNIANVDTPGYQAQRAFEANARTITTFDEITQDTINLKR